MAGSDSHTPAAGSLGMPAIGLGGIEVAMAIAGKPVYLRMPDIWGYGGHRIGQAAARIGTHCHLPTEPGQDTPPVRGRFARRAGWPRQHRIRAAWQRSAGPRSPPTPRGCGGRRAR
ncbi:aconitase family protein [Nonomuraea sp. NPDC050680]|uniref:aconitase family protein n=1 Tax=Nonomuraea sp. NPDC050680 TaxID=3154630 RepID=UPI0033D6D194